MQVQKEERDVTESSWHEGPVSCVAMREDGTIASGGYDGRLILWAVGGDPLQQFQAHESLVNGVAWNPDGDLLATASSDHTARIFAEEGTLRCEMRGHRDDVNGVAWSPDSSRLATASFDGTVRIWDTSSGDCLNVIDGHDSDVNSVSWSPCGQFLATASDDHRVGLWDFQGHAIAMLCGHEDWVDHVSWSPDGQLLASASMDGTARIWDPQAKSCVAVLADHGCTVKAVAWSPEGMHLATAAYDKRVRVFSREGWKLERELHDTVMWNRTLSWGANGRLATGSFGRTPIVWRLREERARTLDVLRTPGINAMAISPNGKLAALACDDGGSRIVELENGRVLRERFDHEGAVLCAAWHPDGHRFAFGGWDDRVSLGDLDHNAPTAWIEGHGDPINGIAYSEDGRKLALGSFMGRVSLATAASGAPLGSSGSHHGSVKWLGALGGGGFVSSGRDGCVRVHDRKHLCSETKIGDTIINSVAASPDGQRVACATRGQGIELFDLTSGSRITSFRDHPVSARTVAFSSDGLRVIAGYYDGHVLIWTPSQHSARLLRPFGAMAISSVKLTRDDTLWVSTWSPRGWFGSVDPTNGNLTRDFHVVGEGS